MTPHPADAPDAPDAFEHAFVVDQTTLATTVVTNGHPQSHVNLADPTQLDFEYLLHIAVILDTLPPGRLRVTHVGGAGLSLARYVQFTRPGSPQIVLEPDHALTEQVRKRLPLPRGHRIRVRGIDGAAGLAVLQAASADVVIVDAFRDGQVPAELTTREFFAQTARVLSDAGVLIVNLADEPGLHYLVRAMAGVVDSLPHAAVVALHDVLKGRRFGNAVMLASRHPLDPDELRRRLARGPAAAGVRAGESLQRLLASARPFDSTDASPSPAPPQPGRWRR